MSEPLNFPGFDFGNVDALGMYGVGFDGDGFDFEPTRYEPTETTIYTRPVVYAPKVVMYDNAEQFARDLTIDNKHETFAFVAGNFVFGDFIEALVDMQRISVKRIGIQTLSLNDENIDSIRNIIEWEGVERLDIALSDYWYSHERKQGGLVDYLFDELDLDGLDLHVAFCSTHAKVFTIETKAGNTLTIHGSANLRSSDNIEQLCITPDRGVFDFCDAMLQRIIETYDVVNQDARKHKSVRGKKLWQAVAAQAAAGVAAEGVGAAAARSSDVTRNRPNNAHVNG